MSSLSESQSGVQELDQEEYSPLTKWEDMDSTKLNYLNVLRGIYAIGFENPSKIQQQAIPPMIAGRDLIAQAQSGTGKTGAFTTGCLHLIDTSQPTIQAVIMAPTRELANQIYDVCKTLGTYLQEFKIQLCVGGDPVDKCIKDLHCNPHIVVGTPGRIQDMMRRDAINTRNMKVMILDEADEMLSSGFKEQIYNIVQMLPKEVQICLFSATIPDECAELTTKFMNNPVKILVKNDMLTLEGITQRVIQVDNDEMKYDTLKDLFAAISVSQCIIYCNSVQRVMDLHDALVNDGFPTCAIHGSMDKNERMVAWNEFKCGKHRVMVSSNVTARGIDIQQVSVVINFDVPRCVHTYLHRIGRSGRWGRKGIGINFVTRRDSQYVTDIESHYKIIIPPLTSFDNLS
jgi:superfamily II DNA/RNA helicase